MAISWGARTAVVAAATASTFSVSIRLSSGSVSLRGSCTAPAITALRWAMVSTAARPISSRSRASRVAAAAMRRWCRSVPPLCRWRTLAG